MDIKELQQEIQIYCKSKVPEEACGLIVHNARGYEFVPCDNMAEDKEHNFSISDQIMLKHSRELVSIFHSHVENGTPAVTLADIKTCEAWGCLGSIVFLSSNDSNICSDLVFYGNNTTYRNYIGRPYYYNVFDCFTLIRDFYYHDLGKSLDFVYSDYGWWEKAEHAESLYLNEYKRLGFEEFDITKPLQVGDILAMRLGRSKCINHGTIYIGNNKILHHLEGKLSCVESFGKYSNRIERGFRYASNNENKLNKVVF